MRRLLVLVTVLGLLAGGALVADAAVSAQAEQRIEQEVARRVPRYTAEVEVDSFPFVPSLLLSGEVRRTRIRLVGAGLSTALGDLASSVDIEIRGLQLDRKAIRAGEARIRGLRSGVARVNIDDATLSQRLGVPVRVEAGSVVVGAGDAAVPVVLGMRGTGLVVAGPGFGERVVAVPRRQLPCERDVSVKVEASGIVLSCTFTEVPRELTG